MSLFIFDKDGTLIRLKLNRLRIPRPVIRPEEQVLIPGVFEKLAVLRAQGHKIAIASNQRAIAQGLISMAQAEALMENLIKKIGGADAWRVCPFDAHARPMLKGKPNPYRVENDCKKPQPGMLIDLMAELGCQPGDTFMIGDSWRDRRAAERCGVAFIPARKFFTF